MGGGSLLESPRAPRDFPRPKWTRRAFHVSRIVENNVARKKISVVHERRELDASHLLAPRRPRTSMTSIYPPSIVSRCIGRVVDSGFTVRLRGAGRRGERIALSLELSSRSSFPVSCSPFAWHSALVCVCVYAFCTDSAAFFVAATTSSMGATAPKSFSTCWYCTPSLLTTPAAHDESLADQV